MDFSLHLFWHFPPSALIYSSLTPFPNNMYDSKSIFLRQGAPNELFVLIFLLLVDFVLVFCCYLNDFLQKLDNLHKTALFSDTSHKFGSSHLLPIWGHPWASLMAQSIKNLMANAGNTRDAALIFGLGRFFTRRKRQPTSVFLPGKSHGQIDMGIQVLSCRATEWNSQTRKH